MSATQSTANAMAALLDWLESVTVHEDMPDLEAEVACFCKPCDNPAATLIVWDCTACGRQPRTYCRRDTDRYVAKLAAGPSRHGRRECPPGGDIVIRCVVPL